MSMDGVLRSFHEACVLGVQQSDNRTAAADDGDEMLIALNDTAIFNETIIVISNDTDRKTQLSPETKLIMDSLISDMCPGQPECSGNGTCNKTECVCYAGKFHGGVLSLLSTRQ